MGTPIEGIVRSKRKVGWGIRHETASLSLEFNQAILSTGSVPLSTRVEEVLNAREPIHNGVIEGIRSTNTFQGSINSRLIHLPTLNPYSDPVLIAYKAVFPIFPEPEIFYPAGTDLHLRTTTELSVPAAPQPSFDREQTLGPVPNPESIESLVASLPTRVSTKKNVDADLINVVFIGSADELASAFRHSGWDTADHVSSRTVFHNLYALLNNSGYAHQPMMTFYLNGHPEDMDWQKSLNSYNRRDHLRIWQWTSPQTNNPNHGPSDEQTDDWTGDATSSETSQSIWISSSTHDTGAVLAVRHPGFVHHITPDLDAERATIVRDLDFAGCIRSVHYVARANVPALTHNAVGDPMHTDGSIAVITLRSCTTPITQPEPVTSSLDYRPGGYVFRFFRRQILTFRNDIFRANVIYGAYDVGRLAFTSLRKPTTRQ
jgi:hypothetical protein